MLGEELLSPYQPVKPHHVQGSNDGYSLLDAVKEKHPSLAGKTSAAQEQEKLAQEQHKNWYAGRQSSLKGQQMMPTSPKSPKAGKQRLPSPESKSQEYGRQGGSGSPGRTKYKGRSRSPKRYR